MRLLFTKILSCLVFVATLALLAGPVNAADCTTATASGTCEPRTPPCPVNVCRGKSCETIGRTALDGDMQTIVACLLESSGHMVWKQTTETCTWAWRNTGKTSDDCSSFTYGCNGPAWANANHPCSMAENGNTVSEGRGKKPRYKCYCT